MLGEALKGLRRAGKEDKSSRGQGEVEGRRGKGVKMGGEGFLFIDWKQA